MSNDKPTTARDKLKSAAHTAAKPLLDEASREATAQAKSAGVWWQRILWALLAAGLAVAGAMLLPSCSGSAVEVGYNPTSGNIGLSVRPVTPTKAAK